MGKCQYAFMWNLSLKFVDNLTIILIGYFFVVDSFDFTLIS